jgi:molybdopterin-guanine dinucleotide biosynthesis protein A
VLTGLMWARDHAPGCDWVVSVACDAPFAPHDLVARLLASVAAEGADMACAMSGGRDHPVFGLWPVALVDDLRGALVDEDIRKVDRWTDRYRLAHAEWPAEPVDPFFNINRPDDLVAAEALLLALP